MGKKFIFSCILFILIFFKLQAASLIKNPPSFFITDIEYDLKLKGENIKDVYRVDITKKKFPLFYDKNSSHLKVKFYATSEYIEIERKDGTREFFKPRIIPGYLSVLPPILAIVMAFIFKDVILSLILGILLGGFFIYDYNLWTSMLRLIDKYVVGALNDSGHISIIVFSLTLGGMVGIISASGGAMGIVKRLTKMVKDFRSGQIASWLMGVLIFFDDYANTLLVGNTMRPLTDKLRISREKLAYIVDSTSAPVASLFIISTWIGFEIGQVDKALNMAPKTLPVVAQYQKVGAFIMFLESVPFRFYAFFSLLLVFLVAYLGRDFGPMYEAEVRARTTGKVLSDGAKPLSSLDKLISTEKETHWLSAFIPIVVLILFVALGLWFTGKNALIAEKGIEGWKNAKLYEVLAHSDSFSVLLWASFFSTLVAIVVSVAFRALTVSESIGAWIEGIKSMVLAMVILTLSWAISSVCSDLKTSYYITMLTRDILSPYYLPVIVFFIAAFVSFSTGTSWGTMGILLPLVLPVAFTLSSSLQPQYVSNIVLGTLAAVLSGAVFGDHCSPISDTTIMSSMSSGCDHIDHVKTQLPYALLVGLVAAGSGFLLIGFGVSPYLALLIGATLLVLIFLFLSKSTGKDAIKNILAKDKEQVDLEMLIKYLDVSEWLPKLKDFSVFEIKSKGEIIKENLNLDEFIDFLAKEQKFIWLHFYLLGLLLEENDVSEDVKQRLEEMLLTNFNKVDEDAKMEILLVAEKLKSKKCFEFFIDNFDKLPSKLKATSVLVLTRLSGKEVLPLLQEVIEKEEGRIRANAIEALLYINKGDLSEEQIKKLVLPYIKDKNFRVRCMVKRVLYKLGEEKKKVISLLKADYEEAKTINDKLSVIYTLSLLDDMSSFKELVDILEKEKDPECRSRILQLIREKNRFFLGKFE